MSWSLGQDDRWLLELGNKERLQVSMLVDRAWVSPLEDEPWLLQLANSQGNWYVVGLETRGSVLVPWTG